MIIIGAGGLATQITDVLQRLYPNELIDYFDNVTNYPNKPTKFGRPIYTDLPELFIELKKGNTKVIMGIAHKTAKEELRLILKGQNVELFQLRAQSAKIGLNNVEIGEGTVILEDTAIESNVKIGKMCLINTSSKIFHDSVIGDFCEIAPMSSILGRCKIGNGVFIGANVIVLPGVEIGDNVIVGAGSIVTKNIPGNSRIKGNPAKAY